MITISVHGLSGVKWAPRVALFAATLVLAACTTAVSPPSQPAPSLSPSALPPPSASAEPTRSAPHPPTITLPAAAPTAPSAKADVLHVRAVQADDSSWTFEVTVQHPDTGWENYADGWDVVTLEGTIIRPDSSIPFTRRLEHPHVDEQPFTRSQSGIVIPPGIAQVRVRAHSLVNGYGGREVVVDLTQQSGSGFEVIPLATPQPPSAYGITGAAVG